jgi:hypothetical protein
MPMKRILVLTLAFLAVASPAWGVDRLCGGVYQEAHPKKLALFLHPQFEKLYNAIPSLSPKEEEWLNEEMVAPGRRSVRVLSSREYTQRTAKRDAGSLYATLGIITGRLRKDNPPHEATSWLRLAYWLASHRDNLPFDYVQLVEKKLLDWEMLPYQWRFMASSSGLSADRVRAIHWGRSMLATHIISCILPAVIGVPFS